MSTENKLPKAGELVTHEMFVHTFGIDSASTILFVSDMSEHGYLCLGKAQVTFTMPDGDPRQKIIDSLQEQIKTERANHHIKITQIEGRIQELLAIGHDGGAA
jgi:hypothetical protein